ncbi:serine/threonine protein phosphatase 1 [Poseidonocella pacifica]|uniref:Serine/threonine protein phosphatase 1 n=1 Tax=Poseidonocella pacifica TaxID=871651 RepID=A0A1I0XAN9_9RHOB|nr:metallophosphoesterase [Poseidonocella pacifica]SFA98139.1 serine/threonine protein phosphatase 1 [Poseidonocella pacifica]
MTKPIYALPDIHGHADKLDAALELIHSDGGPDAEIVFLGDYVDRGPDGAGVLQRLIDGQAAGRPWTCLMGNHDRMLRRFVVEGVAHDDAIKSGRHWLEPPLGGRTTLSSYGVGPDIDAPLPPLSEMHEEARDTVPERHMDFIAGLPLYHQRGDVLFVHAGIRPGVPLRDQAEDDLVWIRQPFLEHDGPFPWLVVHGHTALEVPQHFGNRIDLDGGAGHGRALYPAVIEGQNCWLLTKGGRVALSPPI